MRISVRSDSEVPHSAPRWKPTWWRWKCCQFLTRWWLLDIFTASRYFLFFRTRPLTFSHFLPEQTSSSIFSRIRASIFSTVLQRQFIRRPFHTARSCCGQAPCAPPSFDSSDLFSSQSGAEGGTQRATAQSSLIHAWRNCKPLTERTGWARRVVHVAPTHIIISHHDMFHFETGQFRWSSRARTLQKICPSASAMFKVPLGKHRCIRFHMRRFLWWLLFCCSCSCSC